MFQSLFCLPNANRGAMKAVRLCPQHACCQDDFVAMPYSPFEFRELKFCDGVRQGVQNDAKSRIL
jgi:hypothetical protein